MRITLIINSYLYYVGVHLTVILIVTIHCTVIVAALVYGVLLINVLPQNIYAKGIFCITFSPAPSYDKI